MESKKDIYQLWVQYTTKNEEEYFRKFIKGFVGIWEAQLDLNWENTPEWSVIKADSGPNLSRLPEELLPAIGKFMYIAKDQSDKTILDGPALENVDYLVRCLIVICRYFDNIPFIASCEFVSQNVGIAASIVHEMLNGAEKCESKSIQFVINFCHLLECLYDPYLTWRSFLMGSVVNFEKLSMQPAFLHVEVVPFIYECSQSNLVELCPKISAELLNVLGAVISGARSMILRSNHLPSVERRQILDNATHCLNQGHNALRAICPATVNVVMSVVARVDAAPEVRMTAIQCFVMMVKVLNQSSPDQRQIEVGTVLQLYKEPLLELASYTPKLSSGQSTKEVSYKGKMLGDMVAALRRLLQPASSLSNSGEQLRQVMVDNHMLESVLDVLEECRKYPEQKQKIATICVSTLSSMLHGSLRGKERMVRTCGYDRLLVALLSLGEPARELLEALLGMTTGTGSSGEGKLKDAEALLLLIDWLIYIGTEDQTWVTFQISSLCSADLQSKHLACQKGVILSLCQVLTEHSKLNPKAVNEIIKLLEVLASHSITSYELKEIFLLLREDDKEKFPYRLQLLHTVSSVARKDDFMYSHSYFDIQRETDGISIPDIRKWAGGGAGFSFHCWLRLDEVKEVGNHSQIRRQLFSLTTNAGVGLEAFFHYDGCLVVSINSKKECYSACVSDLPLVDGLWHSVGICHAAARRPFGQNQISMYIDGIQRMAVTVKSPSMTDAFTHCVIGSIIQRINPSNSGSGTKSGESGTHERGLLPTLINQVPSYFTLPLRSSAPLDPNVRSFPAGAQDSVWGIPGCLRGQLGTVCLFQEALTSGHLRTLHDGGPNCKALFWQDEMAEFTELCSKLVFCFSPLACWDNVCLDLSPSCKFSGHTLSSPCHTSTIKNMVNGVGGVQVLLPILESASSNSDEGPDLSFLSPSVEKELRMIENRQNSGDSEDDWEILPSSSYSDWKLEQNPISGFLSLLKNMVAGSSFNQDQLLTSKGLALVGSLMTKVRPELIDVNVLMAVQLLVEMARDASNVPLLRSIHQYILFNFAIWSRAQFHIMIGHIQYLSTIIKEDRKYFRKKFGIPFVLSVVHRYHAPCTLLTEEEGRTVRQSLFGLVRYYLSRESSIREITAIICFLCSVTDENVLMEMVDMLASHLESKSCKDQTIFLLYEQHHCELLHCLVTETSNGLALKQKVLKLIGVLLKSDLVFERNKARLRLHEPSLLGPSSIGLYAGMVVCLRDQPLSKDLVGTLLDQMLQTENSAGFAGALALLHLLSGASLDLKLEAARKVLTNIFMKVYAPKQFAKQVGWQECVTRLLVKQPIVTGALGDHQFGEGHDDSMPELLDLMTFDEENLELEPVSSNAAVGSNHSSSATSRLTSHVSDAATFVEHEIKEVAETVTNAVAGNISYAADNITSVVASACSVFRQKTVEMQGSLEELGETVSRLKQRRSLASLTEEPSETAQASPRLPRMQLPLPGLDLDSISIGNRSQSSTSTEDLSSAHHDAPDTASRDSVSLASVSGVTIAPDDDDSTSGRVEQAVLSDGNGSPSPSGRESALPSELPSWRHESTESPSSPDRTIDEAEELNYLVANILFTVMWRGVEGSSKEAWKERGQVMACINLLGLNNELHCSHLHLKLRLLELATAAALSDLRGEGELLLGSGTAAATENAAQLIRWAYDLVVLDPHDDNSKKSSVKLLDGVLGLLDAMLVFQDAPAEEWGEMAKLAFGILLSCAASDNLELCAIATAKLHALVQTRNVKDLDEAGFLLYSLNSSVEKALDAENQEHYSFLIPVVKALLEKLSLPLNLVTHLPDLPQTQAGPAFFDDFQLFCRNAQWKTFVERKVRPLQQRYNGALAAQLGDAMNTFWAESYEACKVAVTRRAHLVAESHARFLGQLVARFRALRQRDVGILRELQERDELRERLLDARWRTLGDFLRGPRGAWRARNAEERHWKLSRQETFSRMRIKLSPSHSFDNHLQASSLRDNAGPPGAWLWKTQQLPALEIPGAVRRDAADDAPPDDDDLLSLMPDAQSEAGGGSGGVNSGGNGTPAAKDKPLVSEPCELVTLMSKVTGRLEVSATLLSFRDTSAVHRDGTTPERMDFKFPLSRLREIHLRRYNLRRSALEFFLTDQTNYFLNFSAKTRNKVFTRILALRPPNLSSFSSRSPAEMLRASGLTRKWVNREISNFEYLMQLNTLAGRTYSDLSQYPVFPWVVADYTSERLDLENPETFRDLSRPVGVVNPRNEAEVRAKYDSFEDPSGTIAKFHYGTHYSNSAGVLHYLVRVEPFTSLHVELQSGRFDVADRQFHSLPATWRLLMDNPNDVKELTPEFFCFPEFLRNLNKFDLGLLQGTKERVDDVELPPWAESAQDFIYQHRRALESEYVSAHLHEWIDLIFGYKQKGPKAVEALNVFYYCSYEGAVDLDAIADEKERLAVEGMINNFGQTPIQLLREPHPARLSHAEFCARVLKSELRRAPFYSFLDYMRPTPIEVSNDKDPLVFLSAPRCPPRSFLQTGPDTLVSVTRSGIVGTHAWVAGANDRHASHRGFIFDVDPGPSNPKTRRMLGTSHHPGHTLGSQLFALSHDAKTLYIGGHWDCSLRLYSLSKGKTVAALRRHFDVVTCVALDAVGQFLVTGSRDCTAVVWDTSPVGLGAAGGAGGTVTTAPLPHPHCTLYGHDSAVSCVAIMTELDMVVTGSLDGTVNVHTIHEGHFLRTLHPQGVAGPGLEVSLLAVSSRGDVAFAAYNKSSHSIHVFSVNGDPLGSKLVPGRVAGLAVASEFLVVGDDAGDITMSRLLGLHPVYDLPLHVPIQSLVITNGATHLLIPLRDGRVVVLGVAVSEFK